MASGSRYVIEPRATHKATIVWLHDIGQRGVDSVQPLRSLNLPRIKWICPTAPIHPVTSLGGEETNAWCNISQVSANMQHDFESLDNLNSYVLNIFSTEPNNVILGVGGVGLGAAAALYFASCFVFRQVPINLKIVIGINGWLPGLTSLQDNMYSAFGTFNRAATLRVLLTHGTSDDVVPSAFANRCADSLRLAGFPVMFKRCGGDQVMNEVRAWITIWL